MDRQLTELCSKLRDKTTSQEEFAVLEARLAKDAEARDYYLRFAQIHAFLEELPPSMRRLRMPGWGWLCFPNY